MAADGGTGELPLVSVVIATFNRAHMIEHTLRSVAAQTYRRLEAVVVDDGSTDDTEEVVGRIARESEIPVIYKRQTNAGCAAARNVGVSVARGELVAFLDSDDRWVPQAAETMVEALRRFGSDFVYAPSVEVYPKWGREGREIVVMPPAVGRPEAFAAEHFLRHGVRPGAFMLRRQLFLDLGGMDVSLRHNEDSDFVQRLAIGYEGAYVGLPTVRYYHHGGNKSDDRPSIYRALLISNEQILANYPEFSAMLGEEAALKLRELRVRLVEELIVAGRLGEARVAAKTIGEKLPATVRLALAGARWPLDVRRYSWRMVASALARARDATASWNWRRP